MFSRLQIYDPRERAMVGVADWLARPLGWRRARADERPVRRVLLLRLERIGDLLMVLDAIHDARLAWPDAAIDLAVGSWNASLAALIADVNRVDVADAPWLARDGRGDSWRSLVRQARRWRRRRYDIVVNFEPDVRSNLLAWLSGGRRRVGYWTGGGGSFLTDAAPYDPSSHVADNARRLIARARLRRGFGGASPGAGRASSDGASAGTASVEDAASLRFASPRLLPAADAIDRARTVLGTNRRPLIGVHASGGRESKQWHVDRFAAAARQLAAEHDATIVLTGAPGDRRVVDLARRALHGVPFVDASGALDLPTLAALLAELDVLIASDTGPMHLAAAMGTPVVALFGPSDPRRYGPLAPTARIVRVSLWCSPCGRVRLPPERCRGHVPDCMDGISVEAVVTAANELLAIER